MIEWTDNYNIHTAKIGNEISLVCGWHSEGYKISVNGGAGTRSLKNLIPDLDNVKIQVVILGKKVLNESLKELENT